MLQASLARLSIAALVMTLLVAPIFCFAESVSLDIDQLEWQRGQLLPAYCDIPLELGTNVAVILGITLEITGEPKEGTMVLCKGGCDEFPCHQTLHAFFPDHRFINTWISLDGPVDSQYDYRIPLQYSDCYPDCVHSCTGKDVAPENWAFLAEGGSATLRLELRGDLEGCGATCMAENGIDRVTVTVEYEPLIRGEVAPWGSMKAVYR
jgi:hypothetical protein